MLTEIFLHTPKWVFFVFAGLVWLGARQLIANLVSLKRVTVMPVVMTGLAIYGVTSAFGLAPLALFAWAAGLVAVAALVLQRELPGGTRYDSSSRQFRVPGSAVPLALLMGIFFTKYVVGVTLAMHPEVRDSTGFALGTPLLYGAFNGVFAGRALRLWRLAIRDDRLIAGAGSSI
jgi:hypothetical protein